MWIARQPCLALNCVSPRAGTSCSRADDAPTLDDKVAARLAEAFGRGTGYGLLQLGAGEVGQSLPPAFVWWRDFAGTLCGGGLSSRVGWAGETPSAAILSAIAPPAEAELATFVLTAPMMPGAEYLTADILRGLWVDLGIAFAAAFTAAGTDLQAFLKTLNPAWNLIGRVHFNLAENRRDPEWPFAFLATYTTRLSAQARAQHVPLGQALREYAGAANRDKLLSLLVPVQRAAERCRLAQGHGRYRRDLSSLALESGRGRTAPEQRARPGKRRCGRALARSLARGPPVRARRSPPRLAPVRHPGQALTLCSTSTWT